MGLAEVSFRSAEPDDAPAVAALHADSWRRHYRGAYSDDFLDGDVEADRLAVWTERLGAAGTGASTVLAEDGGVLVGFVHVVLDEDPEWGSLVDNLHVVHGRKRSGIGTRLLSQAAGAVVRHGPRGVHLWVLEQNVDAQAFYRARGGVNAGRRPVQPPGGIPGRLRGSPAALRFVWPDPHLLIG